MPAVDAGDAAELAELLRFFTESGIQVDLGHCWRDVVDDVLDFGPIRSAAGSCDLAKAAICERTSVAVTTPAP